MKNWLAVLSPVTTVGLLADAKIPPPVGREKEGLVAKQWEDERALKLFLKAIRVQNA